MDVIKNKWVEKVKKKKSLETAPSYETIRIKEMDDTKPKKRHTAASRGAYQHTLRGLRK